MSDILKNVITFGAHGRITNKEDEYKQEVDSLKELNWSVKKSAAYTNVTLVQLTKEKTKAVKALKLIESITKKIKSKKREINNNNVSGYEIDFSKFDAIENIITTFDMATNLSKGAMAGASTVMGAWALAGSIGTASTGTAISSLSGAAATKATLALFGGGSIASGGGGIVLGRIVLGGIAIIPGLALTGIFNHLSANKKIVAIEKEIVKIQEHKEEQENNLLLLDLTVKRAIELTDSIKKTTAIFKKEIKKCKRKIYPIPIVSRLIKWLKHKNGNNYFNEKNIEEIMHIIEVATSFTKIIETKIFNEDGTLV
jgi:hypothetical protein